jgi:hypothetical protein
MKNILIYFKYQNKNYVVYYHNNEIKYGTLDENNNILNNLNSDEYHLIDSIYQFVSDKSHLIDAGSLNLFNKNIKVFFNKKNGIYSFYEIKNNTFENLPEFILKVLNNYYNNETDILYDDLKQERSHALFYRRVVNTSLISLTLIISSQVCASSISKKQLDETEFKFDYRVEQMINQQQFPKEKINYEAILKTALQTNPSLTEEEKKYISLLASEIEENYQYMDLNETEKNLSRLKIKYYSSASKEIDTLKKENHYSRRLGLYIANSQKNEICLYGTKYYKTTNFSDCDTSILFHELNHALNRETSYDNLANKLSISAKSYGPRYLEEMVNELFSREYFASLSPEDYTKAYAHQMPVIYALSEIINDDTTLRKFKFNSNNNYIIEKLLEIDPDESLAYELITSINSISLYDDMRVKTATKDFSKTLEDIACEKNYQKIYQIIKHYYELKFNRQMEDDLVMDLYFYNTPYATDLTLQNIITYLGTGSEENEVIPKGYVSKYYKEMHPDVTYNYKDFDGQYCTFHINSQNRYIDTNNLKK